MVFTAYGPRLEAATIEAVFNLDWDGPIAHLFQRDNPHGHGRESILYQYQQGRRAFLGTGYDGMLVVESDILPPPDALERLASLDADLAYGVYRFRTSEVCNVFEKYPPPARNTGSSITLKPSLLQKARAQGVYECTGGGLGCVLIRRRVMEEVDFRLKPKDGAHCDTYFNRDVLRAGFSQKADINLICGHIIDSGEVVWPYHGEKGHAVS